MLFMLCLWSRCGQIARCSYYFLRIVVIRYKTKATARRALTFIVRISVNDTIAIAVWTCFHVCASKASRASPLAVQSSLSSPLSEM